MSTSNPRMVPTINKPDARIVEVGNAHRAVFVSHGDGVVEYALTPGNARKLADILRWQADMAEQEGSNRIEFRTDGSITIKPEATS